MKYQNLKEKLYQVLVSMDGCHKNRTQTNQFLKMEILGFVVLYPYKCNEHPDQVKKKTVKRFVCFNKTNLLPL